MRRLHVVDPMSNQVLLEPPKLRVHSTVELRTAHAPGRRGRAMTYDPSKLVYCVGGAEKKQSR